MKKSVNKFAVALWVLAALALLSDTASFATVFDNMRELASHGDLIYVVEGPFSNILRMAVLTAVQLASVGVLIELVDQIRWNALHRKS